MIPPRSLALGFTVALTVALAAAEPAGAGDTVPGFAIAPVRVVRGTGAPALEGATILVVGGRIEAVSDAPPPAGVRVVDGTGLTALPGLIDSHVHLGSVPGAVVRGDSPAEQERLRRQQLRATVAAGVTTVLDAAAPRDGLAWVAAHVTEGDAAPSVRMLAPFLTPVDGYFAGPELRAGTYDDLWDPIGGPADLDAALDAAVALPAVAGVKVVVETGVGPFEVWETWTPEMRARIRDGAKARGLPVFVHSMTGPAHELALELEPVALMHGGYADAEPAPETLERIRASGAHVVSTLTIYDMLLVRFQPERLADPLLAALVPAPQLATAADPEAWDHVVAELVALNAPSWIPSFLHGPAAWWFLSERAMTSQAESAVRAIGRMHAGGIPIVAGTDAGTWPVMTTGFHGVSLARELELLVRAGLTPGEAIVAATSRPARMLGIDAEVGTLERGKRADILLVRGDPLAEIRALREVEAVVLGGELRSPAAWLRPAGSPPPASRR